jgi:hypothetical protein
MSWSSKNIATGVAISGVVTAQPVTVTAPVTSSGALNGIIKITAAAVTQVGTITPKVQTAIGSDWVDVKSGTAITVAGVQYIRWNIEVAADQTVLPLLNSLRVVLTTTNAGDAITLSKVELLQG